MHTQKQIFQQRIRRMVEHKSNPAAPVDASTLLLAESARLSSLPHPVARKMAWAYKLSAYRLESLCDPASLVRYNKAPPAESEDQRPT